MFRKSLFAALLLAATPSAAFAQAAPASAADPVKMQEARAIIAVMFPPDQREQKIRDMLDSLLGQMRGSMLQLERVDDPGLKAILDRFINGIPDKLMPTLRQYFPAMLEATAEAYTHEFSLEELKQIHAFAQTPAGAHYFSKVTDLLRDPSVARANERYFAALKVLQDKEAVGLKQEVMTYLKAHPDVMKKLQSANR